MALFRKRPQPIVSSSPLIPEAKGVYEVSGIGIAGMSDEKNGVTTMQELLSLVTATPTLCNVNVKVGNERKNLGYGYIAHASEEEFATASLSLADGRNAHCSLLHSPKLGKLVVIVNHFH